MANKQYLIELAVRDDKLKSSLQKSLGSKDVQKTLGILGENITEYLEKDINKAASILGKVDWASLLGEKDFERLQQLVAKTVSANKDLIKSFVKSNDVQGIQNAIELVSALGNELKAINPDQTVAGLARSMASFIKVIEPLSGQLNSLTDAPDKIASAFGGMAGNVDKSMTSTYNRASKTLEKMQNDVLKHLRTQLDASGESIIKYQIDDKELNEYISKFEDAESVAKELNKEIEKSQTALRKLNNADTRDASTMLSLVKNEQRINALMAKLSQLQPSINGGKVTKEIDATIEQVVNKLEKSFNKTIEDKLSSIKVTVDVPTEEKLISDLNAVIAKVNQKGTNSLKLVGAESAIDAAQKQILKNTETWHNDMKKFLKFDKKEDIMLDLGVKLRDIGHNVGEDLQRSIEEYFDNPANKVSVPVELVLTGENKAIIEGGGGNITINGGVGGGEITAESLAKALTTPIEVKTQNEQPKDKPTGKFIYLDPEDGFSQNVLSVFDDLFKAIERGGQNAQKISQYFSFKGLNLEELKKFQNVNPMQILNAYAAFLENADASIFDSVSENLAKGSTKNNATEAFRDLLRDSIFRFDLSNITVGEDVKRSQVRKLVENDYIPRSQAQESIYKIRNTKAKDYKLPTVEELDKLMLDLPRVWGKLGEDFLPALESLKQLRSTITDPTNATEIKNFQEAADAFALNTNSLYREMSDFMHGYKIGVFNKGHSKHNKYFDYSVNGGVFSGSKLASKLDQVDYFELYDDPSGHFSRGNRKDAMDNASSHDRYQLRRDSRNASYRTQEPAKTSVLTEDVEVQKFKPKERPNEELQAIDEAKKNAQERTKAIEDARKASVEEEKAAEELRKQELLTDKKKIKALRSQRTKNENKLKNTTDTSKAQELTEKNEQLSAEIEELKDRIAKNSIEPTKTPTVKQQLDVLPKAQEIQSMIDDVNAIDVKIAEAQKQKEELNEWVNKNLKTEKNTKIEYTKSEVNNQNKNKTQNSKLQSLAKVLNYKNITDLDSWSDLTEKEQMSVSKLLNNRKLYQLINGSQGLGLPQNSQLEDIAKNRIQEYQKGLNQIDEFIVKHQRSIGATKNNADLVKFMENEDVRKVLAGTFKGTKEDESAIRTKIDEFKARMVEAGKSYVADYIDMWSDKNLRELMNKDSVQKRTLIDTEGDSILQKFYHRIIDGGVSKRGEAYQYLKTESAKYQKNIQKDEASLGKVAVSVWEQSEVTDANNQAATERVKEKYKEYVNQWLYTIQENMYNVLFGELSNKDAALVIKKNDELRGLVGSLASDYSKNFGESLLTEEQSRILDTNKSWYTEFTNQEASSLTTDRNKKQADVDKTIQEKAELLRQRRFDLLNKISDGTEKGKDTASLEKALLEVEDELVKYSDQLPHLIREEFEADLLNAKNATEEEWKAYRTKISDRERSDEINRKSRNDEALKSALGTNAARNMSRLVPSDADIQLLKLYNKETEKLIALNEKKLQLAQQGKDTSDIDEEIRAQQKSSQYVLKTRIEHDKEVAAAYAPANQAAKFIEATDKTLYILDEQEKEANNKLRIANDKLATMQGDGYKTSRIYRDRIESLKDREVAEYVRSNEYRSRRDKGVEQANEEFGAYLTTALKKLPENQKLSEEEFAKKIASIVYEFSKNEDRANIDEMLGGAGNTTRLVKNAFGKTYVEEHMKYTGGTTYKKLVDEAKKNREEQIDAELASDREIKDAKIQEIWNTTKADIQKLRKADMANSKELRDAVFAQAEKDGMGDSSEYRRAIVDRVREQLIQERIDAGRQEQKFYNNQYYEKARELRSKLSPDMYKRINEQTDQAVYNAVMAKIQGLVGDNKDLLKNLDTKRKELIETYTSGIVQQYRDSLAMEETGMYGDVNVREMMIKELTNTADFYGQKYIEASGKLGMLKNERARAQSFGELGYDEVANPEIAKVRADAEARLSAEKEKQVELTERLTNLTAQNADQEVVQSVAAELQATEKEIGRLQILANGAANALSLRKEAREVSEAESKFSLDKLRLWLIDDLESAKRDIESDDFSKRTNAEKKLPFLEQKLADVERRIDESKPEVEKPKTVLDMIANAIRSGLAGVTAGGTVDLDASLYNIATETTLQEILRLLGGNGAVEYANQLKAELAKDRPRYEKRNYEGNDASGGRSGGKKARVNKDLDKLNDDGQRIYGELDAQAEIFTTSLKNGNKKYAENFNFVEAINKQVDVLNGLEKQKKKGTLEYIQAQTNLTTLYQDYYNKTFGKGKKKKGQPGQSAWAEKDKDLKKIEGLKDKLLFKYKRADALVGLNYGVEGATQTTEEPTQIKQNKKSGKKTNKSKSKEESVVIEEPKETEDAFSKAVAVAMQDAAAKGLKVSEAEIREMVKATMDAIKEGGLGRDVNDEAVNLKGELAQSLYDAIIEGYKAIASGDAMYSEMSYGVNKEGKVTDIQHGTMWGTPSAKADYLSGHTHINDILFSSADFKSAAKNSGIMDILELITPFNKYRIEGLQNINPDELAAKFGALSVFAKMLENIKTPHNQYNDMMVNAIAQQGLTLTSTPTDIAKSPNFTEMRSFDLLQAASNHGFSLSSFENAFYKFVDDLKKVQYQFDSGSPLARLVESIQTIRNTQYESKDIKSQALEGLRPLLEEVFGVKPNTQIDYRQMEVLSQIALKRPILEDELFDREMKFAEDGKTLFTQGHTMFGLGRDVNVKTEVKEGVKEGIAENSKTSTSNKKTPYEISPDSIIGKLQNTVGGNTGALAQQATLALVLSELQAISKKIPTIGKAGVKSSAQNLLEEFQKMAAGSAMDGKERVAYFDLVNGAMSPSLSGAPASIPQKLLNTLSQDFGVDKGYRSQIHTHADSDQTWFSGKDLDHFKKNISDDFGANDIKQQILLTKDTITVFDMTMVETAENAKKAIEILKAAGKDVNNETLEKLANLGATYQTKNLDMGAKSLMDLLGVKNYQDDGKKKGTTVNPKVAQKGLEDYAQADADRRNSKYIFNSFDGETLKYQLVDMEGHISKVILTWDELENKVRVVSDTSTSSLDATVRKIQEYRDEIAKAKNEKLLSDGDDTNFVAAEEEVNKILKQIEEGDLSGEQLSEAINTLDAAREKLANEGAKLHKLIVKNEKLRSGTAEVKSAVTQGTKIRSQLGDLIETDDINGIQLFNVDDNVPEYLKQYILAYNELIKKQQQYITDGQINNPKIQDALRVQAEGVKRLGREAMRAYQNTQDLQEKSAMWESQTYTDKAGYTRRLGGSKYVGMQNVDRTAMLQYAKEVLGADLASVKLNTTTGKLTGVLRKNNYVVADMAVVYDETTGMMHLFQEKEHESLGGLPGFMHALKEKSKAITQYLVSMTSIYRVVGELRQGIQYIREIDSALTELKKVTDETEETYDRFLDTAAKTADKVGSTIQEVVNSTADWARIGYSLQDATTLAESTAVLLNVSEFQSIDDATSALTSTLQAFGYVAEDSMKVVDVLNEVGNNFAISSDGIATALQDSASSLMAANNSYEQAVALIAAANRVVILRHGL